MSRPANNSTNGKFYVRFQNLAGSTTQTSLLNYVQTILDCEPDDLCALSKDLLEFESYELAKQAIKLCDGKCIDGNKVGVRMSSGSSHVNINKNKLNDKKEPTIPKAYSNKCSPNNLPLPQFSKSFTPPHRTVTEYPANGMCNIKTEPMPVKIKAPEIEPLSDEDEPLPPKPMPSEVAEIRGVKREFVDEDVQILEELQTNQQSNQPPKKVQKVHPVQKIDTVGPQFFKFNEFLDDTASESELDIQIKKQSSNYCNITWEIPLTPKCKDYFTSRLELSIGEVDWSRDKNPEDEVPMHLVNHEIFPRKRESIYVKQQRLNPGTFYRVKIEIFDRKQDLLATGSRDFRATFSRREIQQLFDKALQFSGELMHPFEVMYRCKPLEYWDKIYNENIDNMRFMMPYLKDENGQAASPINRRLYGLFFSAHRFGENLPTFSPFGEVRMILEAEAILDFTTVNLYFCDFYCSKENSYHYVTLVVCKIDSEWDKICKERLIKLDPYTNKFMKVMIDKNSSGNDVKKYFISARKNFLVEIYYTEPVSLFQAKEFEIIDTLGKGSSRPMGLPHYKQCTICNLNPIDFKVIGKL